MCVCVCVRQRKRSNFDMYSQSWAQTAANLFTCDLFMERSRPAVSLLWLFTLIYSRKILLFRCFSKMLLLRIAVKIERLAK